MGTPVPTRPSPPVSPVPQPIEGSGEAQVEAQLDLESQLGLEIRGALGGLPVAEQNQEYFAVFDEAGDTGPEIIDKTQFRVTYLVDSNLNTSKPSENSDAAINTTQNFEEGKTVVVRADNATVLNRNLTGEQFTYDVGTIRLIATTETGSSPGGFIPTMSFVDTRGQDIVQDALDVSIEYGADDDQSTSSPNENFLIQYNGNAIKPISSSGDPFYSVDANVETLTIERDSTEGGTRIKVFFNVFLQGNWNTTGNPAPGAIQGNIRLEQQTAGTGNYIVVRQENFSIPYGNSQYFYPAVEIPYFKNFVAGTKFRCRLTRTDGLSPNQLLVKGGRLKVRQEYLPGDVSIPGLNACTASYFEPTFTTFEPVSASNNPQGYSVITSSVQMGYFINNGFRAKLDDQSKAFDPKGDNVTFENIQVPFDWQVGDEIRFEYNKNKVHKIVDTTELNTGAWAFTLTPSITSGSELNHFTHYRVEPDGGYIIVDSIKNNQVNENQPFSGIILPRYPSENLKEQSDNLIFRLKQAGIIEK